jgi:hypothetical protein
MSCAAGLVASGPLRFEPSSFALCAAFPPASEEGHLAELRWQTKKMLQFKKISECESWQTHPEVQDSILLDQLDRLSHPGHDDGSIRSHPHTF